MSKHALEVGSSKATVKRNMKTLMGRGMLLKMAQSTAFKAAALTKVKRSKKAPLALALRKL